MLVFLDKHRLGFIEDTKTMPYDAVWNYYCKPQDMVQDLAWIDEVFKYEKDVLDKRI